MRRLTFEALIELPAIRNRVLGANGSLLLLGTANRTSSCTVLPSNTASRNGSCWLPAMKLRPRTHRQGQSSNNHRSTIRRSEDALHQARAVALPVVSDWDFPRALVHHVANIWSQPDQGILGNSRFSRITSTYSRSWPGLLGPLDQGATLRLQAPLDPWRSCEKPYMRMSVAMDFNSELVFRALP